LWFVIYGYWDDKKNIAKFVEIIKCYFGIDFKDYTQSGCIYILLLHRLRQIQKYLSNEMNKKHGLTLQKSSNKHKIPGKNWSMKRVPGEFKNDFIFWRHGNASQLKFNNYCDKHNLQERRVEIEEVDTSIKILPNVEDL